MLPLEAAHRPVERVLRSKASRHPGRLSISERLGGRFQLDWHRERWALEWCTEPCEYSVSALGLCLAAGTMYPQWVSFRSQNKLIKIQDFSRIWQKSEVKILQCLGHEKGFHLIFM